MVVHYTDNCLISELRLAHGFQAEQNLQEAGSFLLQVVRCGDTSHS